MTDRGAWQIGCPITLENDFERIQLAHGEGARASRSLIEQVILPRFAPVKEFADAALVDISAGRLAIATDSHTVSPLFFPGGDIGSLAVYGTVNDLAVAGAVARWLTLSLIIEEGLPIRVLERVLDSAARAASECSVDVVAGDTKVVPRGTADGLFVNTTGVGETVAPVPVGPSVVRNGDQVIVSGPIGRHGIAVLCAREEFSFETTPVSDSATVQHSVRALLNAVGNHVRCIRDATRGGVSAVLHEWAAAADCTFELVDSCIPVTDDVRGACELLGLDPLYVANEGTFVVAVAPHAAARALAVLRDVKPSHEAAIIGTVTARGICPVTSIRALGTAQPVDEPSGAPLPRIC